MQPILKLIILYYFLIANYIQNLDASGGNETDYEALMAIKAQITPDSVPSSWNKSLHFCEWEGVTCGRKHRRVVALELVSSRIDGTLSPFVGNLSFLRLLDLSKNFFRGYIPLQISHLRRLGTLNLQANSFEGEIPANMSSCLNLRFLLLDTNKLAGGIPAQVVTLSNLVEIFLGENSLAGYLEAIGIGNMSNSLQRLSLAENQLQGSIPDDFGRLKGLVWLDLGENMLSGNIPRSLYNLSELETLSLGINKFDGDHLPQDLGRRLPRLVEVYLSHLSLTGQVPTSISNLSKLEILEISNNNFTGGFYFNGNNWPNLFMLNLDRAFHLKEARDLSFVDTLANCTNLIYVMLGYNSFTGIFPRSILNLSMSLQNLHLFGNQLLGQIPLGLGKFVNLIDLELYDNHFIGSIPDDIANLKKLESLDLSFNNISGEIPSSFGNLTRLSLFLMQFNNLEGPLPGSLGNCKNMLAMNLQDNKLSGVLPIELFGISSLIQLWISQNNFQGSLPLEISGLKNLYSLDVSANRFSGQIPSTLGACTSLEFLYMSRNSFDGSIPESLSPLKSIKTLDLSYNNLSGPIPTYLSTWPYLSSLDFSYNAFEGEVLVNGVFSNPDAVSIVGNNKLCGGVVKLQLPKCPTSKESRRRRLSLKMIVAISIVLIISISLAVVAVCYYLMRSSRKNKNASSGFQDIKPLLKVSYQMLSRATNGFSPSNLLGVGGFGSVYKGILHQDDTELVVAVKVMNLQNERSRRSFNAECKVLRNIRHRNLVKVITSCSSLDAQLNNFKALVYEFMPKGSLESWLHSSLVTDEHVGDAQSCALSLIQRLSIAIDVACALEYLHGGCEIPIIHCDLKPSNILLDDEMTAHVGDFGLAKLLSGNTGNLSSSTQVRGTIGYAAPEYGLGSSVSPEGDIYSFGIIVLEMMTSKRPTDPVFSEGLNLHNFAQSALSSQLMEVMDQSMLGGTIVLPARTGADIKKIECIKSLIRVGVQCSLEQPQKRMSIKDVVNELKSATRTSSIQELRSNFQEIFNSILIV